MAGGLGQIEHLSLVIKSVPSDSNTIDECLDLGISEGVSLEPAGIKNILRQRLPEAEQCPGGRPRWSGWEVRARPGKTESSVHPVTIHNPASFISIPAHGQVPVQGSQLPNWYLRTPCAAGRRAAHHPIPAP